MSARRLKIIGWGYEGEEISPEEHAMVTTRFRERFKSEFEIRKAPTEESIELHASRLAIPAAIAPFSSAGKRDRLIHTYGKSFPDYARAFEGDFANAPDIVAFARSEADIEAVYDFATGANVAVIPFGGGTSVCGGVEPAVGGRYNGTISLDLTGLDRILEIDKTSRAARIQGGIRVPALEEQLKGHGLTLRHFPQSMELATLGGMIATRSGGHFATLYTHIDDFVESLRTVTPAGTIESRRLPGSGAGPSPDRMMIGSEGAFGIITEAWMRLQNRPSYRGGTAVLFDDVFKAAEAVRVICQAALFPANVRLLDAREAWSNGFGDGSQSVVVLSFENDDILSTRGSTARWRSAAATEAATTRSGRAAARATGRARPAPGATPSSACPTTRRPSSRWASSPTRSRPRSPGNAFPTSTRRSWRPPSRRHWKSPGSPASCPAVSRTVTPTGRRPISRSRPRDVTARSPNSGWRSRAGRSTR
jgi:alkyldihydroxyacetonephosphate synthase